MSVAPAWPLRFQIGARTVGTVRRALARVPLDLDDALAACPPALPTLPPAADGYLVTSLPVAHRTAMLRSGGGMLAFERQAYTRRYADLTIGHAAYLDGLSGNTRAAIRRKRRKIVSASGGTLDIRRYRTPDELAEFHATARTLALVTYQERLMGSGLPDTPDFMRRMVAMAAAGQVRAWLLRIDDAPAAYLYCPVHGDTVIYEYVGHDPRFNDLSPGSVLQAEAFADLFADPALKRFDFTEGDGQHKRQFATGGVACVDLLLLRPTIANRAIVAAMRAFDGGIALAKRIVARFDLDMLARRVRRTG